MTSRVAPRGRRDRTGRCTLATAPSVVSACVIGLVNILLAAACHAAMQVTDSGAQYPANLPVPSGTDLLQTHRQSGAASGTSYSTNVSGLYDGSLGLILGVSPYYFPGQTDGTMWAYDGDAVVTLVLDGRFDLTGISVWTGYGAGARSDQYWDVYTSADGGNTWSGSPLYTEFSGNVAVQQGMCLQLADSSGVLAANVSAVKFNVYKVRGTDTEANIFREIDILGIPSVPEPASALLLLAGCLALRRRR